MIPDIGAVFLLYDTEVGPLDKVPIGATELHGKTRFYNQGVPIIKLRCSSILSKPSSEVLMPDGKLGWIWDRQMKLLISPDPVQDL